MAIDPSLVTIELSRLQPAISYLQVTLVILAGVIVALSWICLRKIASFHYSSSLLGNLYATTNVGGSDTSQKPCYISNMPEMRLSQCICTQINVQRRENLLSVSSLPRSINPPYP